MEGDLLRNGKTHLSGKPIVEVMRNYGRQQRLPFKARPKVKWGYTTLDCSRIGIGMRLKGYSVEFHIAKCNGIKTQGQKVASQTKLKMGGVKVAWEKNKSSKTKMEHWWESREKDENWPTQWRNYKPYYAIDWNKRWPYGFGNVKITKDILAF